MEDEVRRLQDSLRQLIYGLSDHYREHMEQLLWTKWGQRIPRSESKRALAELVTSLLGLSDEDLAGIIHERAGHVGGSPSSTQPSPRG